MIRVLLAWLWVGLCIAVIWAMSGDAFSARSTSRFLTPLLRWLDPDISGEALLAAHYWVRRTAHVAEYALLAVLSFRALRLTLDVSLARVTALCLGLVLVVAGTDELRQSVMPTRGGSLADVALDFAAGALGVLLIVTLHRWLGIGLRRAEDDT
jgi:VanZ family protein